MTEFLKLLKERKSVPISQLTTPGPRDDEIREILETSLRVPDYGQLKPWRIKVLKAGALEKFAHDVLHIYKTANTDAAPERLEKEQIRFLRTPMVLVIGSNFKESKVTRDEQLLSGGALCENILLAIHALGYGANWLTGWPAHHPAVKKLLHILETDLILGFIFVGSVKNRPLDRERPKLEEIVEFC